MNCSITKIAKYDDGKYIVINSSNKGEIFLGMIELVKYLLTTGLGYVEIENAIVEMENNNHNVCHFGRYGGCFIYSELDNTYSKRWV